MTQFGFERSSKLMLFLFQCMSMIIHCVDHCTEYIANAQIYIAGYIIYNSSVV